MALEPDELDRAAQLTQENTDRAINEICQQVSSIDTRNPLGRCWNCGETIGHDRRWCDAHCRDDWSREFE